MNKKPILLIVLVISFVLVTPMIYATCPAIMPAGWDCPLTFNDCLGDSDAYTGKCSVQLTLTNNDPNGNYYINHNVSLDGPSAYRITFFAKSNDAQYIYLRLTDSRGWTNPGEFGAYPAATSADHHVPFQSSGNLHSSWTKYTFETHTISEKITNIQLFVGVDSYDYGKSALIDSVHIERLSSSYSPTLEDYGFINNEGNSANKYLCYNYNNVDLSKATLGWTWLNAMENNNPFKILTIGTTQGSTDIISNGDKWNYCNATGTEKLNGIPIKEYGTFTNKYQSDTGINVPCYEVLTLLTGQTYYNYSQTPHQYPACIGSIDPQNTAYINSQCQCYVQGSSTTIDLCSLPQIAPLCEGYEQNTSGDLNYVEKNLCGFDLASCLNESFYDRNAPCNQQNNYGRACENDQICLDGTFVTTKGKTASNQPDFNKCCFGQNSKCVATPTIQSNLDCEQIWNGTPYSTNEKDCLGSSVSIAGSDTNFCCFGQTYYLSYFGTTWYGSVSPDAFICFRQEGNNKIADCCYGSECANRDNLLTDSPYFLDESKNRIQSTGTVLHTVANFDVFDKATRHTIIDRVRKITSNPRIISIEPIFNTLFMADFTYLEFDIAYNSRNIGEIYINNVNYGSLFNYLNNGKEPMRWHHAIIKLRPQQKTQSIGSLGLNVSGKTTILIDNIILTPESQDDLLYNSKNYYCTGGFGTWIGDLDPNLTQNPILVPPLPDTFWADWKQYGQYRFACEAQGSFGWTGHQCCGDDTKLTNYGELFNDTAAGCFNGTFMNSSYAAVWDAKHIFENTPEYNYFIYKDLIYYNDTYVGCQVQTTKYDNLKLSYNGGFNSQNIQLVNNTVNSQCTVRGKYYCMNNAWHYIIPGYNDNDPYRQIQMPPPPGTIFVKNIPPGTDLIQNGEFGGEPEQTGGAQRT